MKNKGFFSKILSTLLSFIYFRSNNLKPKQLTQLSYFLTHKTFIN